VMTKEEIIQTATDYIKNLKKTHEVNVSHVKNQGTSWKLTGTTPIDLEGHPWIEKFEMILDQKGKIRSCDFCLL